MPTRTNHNNNEEDHDDEEEEDSEDVWVPLPAKSTWNLTCRPPGNRTSRSSSTEMASLRQSPVSRSQVIAYTPD